MIGLRKIDSGALAEEVRSMGRPARGAKPLAEASEKGKGTKVGIKTSATRFGGRRLREGLKVVSGFDSYSPWSGAEDTYRRIADAGKLGELEDWLEGMYPDGIGETELNDLLWFDADTVLRAMGLSGDGDSAEGDDGDTDDEVLSAMGESADRGSERILEYGNAASMRYSRFIKPYLTGDDEVYLDYYGEFKDACIDAMGRIDNGTANSVKDAVDGALDVIDESDSYWAILWHNADYTEPHLDDAFSRFASTVTSAVSDYAESKGKKDEAKDWPDKESPDRYMKFISHYFRGRKDIVLNFDEAFEAVCKKAIGLIDDGTRTKVRDAAEDAVDSVIGNNEERNWAILHHYCDEAYADYDEAIEAFVRDIEVVLRDYVLESDEFPQKQAPKAKADESAAAIAEGKASEGLAEGTVFAVSGNRFEPSSEDDDVGSFAGF